jgi:hypothetical protein
MPAYLDEHCIFPNGRFDDQVDASSGAVCAIDSRRARFYAADLPPRRATIAPTTRHATR